ncbi:MAG TPA: hypothetical protein PLL17_06110 [Defluviitaleaceae bacterium]|nr:hypothetical protein [Defluviitaleaceae bacterium]
MILFYSVEATKSFSSAIEFSDNSYRFYPFEILFLIYVRNKQGLPVLDKFDDLLMSNPEAKMIFKDPEPYPQWDPLLRMIDDFYCRNYSDYFPNKYGSLFQ